MNYKYILFDLDGTLTDPKVGITTCVSYALKYFGITENPDNLTHFIGPPLREQFEISYNLNHEESKVALEKYRERFSKIGLYENKVYPKIKELLQRLKEKGCILAVATSKPTVYSVRILKKFNLYKYFNVVVGSELDGRRIDKKEVIQEVINQLNIKKDKYDKIIMVGDRKHDIIGAKKCNIKSIGVKYGYALHNELENENPTKIVSSVEELEDYLI